MKQSYFLWTGVIIGLGVGFWCVLNFCSHQEHRVADLQSHRQTLLKDLRSLEEEENFRRTHAKEISDLMMRGWMQQTPRLIAADWLETVRPLLKALSYTFEAEVSQQSESGVRMKSTPFILETRSAFDVEVYQSVALLLEKFPGLLIPQEVMLVKTAEGVEGKLTFNWVNFYEH